MTATFVLLAFAVYAPTPAPSDAEKAAQRERDALKGEWVAVKLYGPNGLTVSGDELAKHAGKWDFGGDGTAVLSSMDFAGGPVKYTFTIDGSKSPKTIDLTMKDRGLKQFGIYKIEKGTLTLCWAEPGAAADNRPTEFEINDKVRMTVEMW